MIHAYDKYYLRFVQNNLALFFDLSINVLNYTPGEISTLFQNSIIAKGIEKADIKTLVSITSLEMIETVTGKAINVTDQTQQRSKQYWAGWILAQLQWQINKTFEEIFSKTPLDFIISMYDPYHQASDDKAIDELKKIICPSSYLQRRRIQLNLTQSQLAKLSNVNINTIQLYEQNKEKILGAKGSTLASLASILQCNILDLLSE